MSKVLLKNGEVVSSEAVVKADVLIENGKIVMVGDCGEIGKDVEVVDCKGKHVFPGFVDGHVHFRDPGMEYKEDFESGSRAAVAGGVTTVLDMPNTLPPVISKKVLDEKRRKVSGKSYCNFGFFVLYDGVNVEELNKIKNIAGIKVFSADSTGDLGIEVKFMSNLFEKSEKLVVVHCEDSSVIDKNMKHTLLEVDGLEVDPAIHSKIRSVKAETKALKFVCGLTKEYGTRLHVAHLTSAEGLEIVSEARDYGVTCEVAPHHLMLSRDDYEVLGNFIKVNPPIRDGSDVLALWLGLKDGRIDIIATDHAPHTVEEKQKSYQEAPAGIPEVETTLPLLMTVVDNDGLTLKEVVKLCCERPCEIYGIKNKGWIKEGYDADIVVVDMELEKKIENKNLQTKCGWSPYDGSLCNGWPIYTFVNGEKVFENGKIVGNASGKEVEF